MKSIDRDLARGNNGQLSWQAPDLYKRLASPVATEDAKERIAEFERRVRSLREELQIPEVLLMTIVYVNDGQENINCRFGACAFGAAGAHEHMAALGFNVYAAPILEHADFLREIAFRTAPKDINGQPGPEVSP